MQTKVRGPRLARCDVILKNKEIPMQMTNIPFGTIDWSSIEPTEHKGETGTAFWRTRQFDNIRVRMVEYGPGYLADHWCTKGHILLCLEGELHTELADGRKFILTPGMSYQVADNAEPHRSHTSTGVKLFIID
jgi:quercetin dioxygenase-like cupin family protein